MSNWFDIGVNLTDKRLEPGSTIESALSVGVKKIAVTGTSIEASNDALALCKKFSAQLVCTAGIHPHYAKDVTDNYLQQLTELAGDPLVVAIGECGLDFNRNFSPADAQLAVFEQQLNLASDLSMPVFLHERDAFEQQLSLLKKYQNRLTGGVVHCFTGTLEQMQRYLELGLYIGITGWVCDPKRGDALREAVSKLPLERVLLETDAPYLMPKTLKSKSRNNQPANLPHIAETVSTLMKVEVHQLQKHSFQNAMTLFQLDDKGQANAV